MEVTRSEGSNHLESQGAQHAAGVGGADARVVAVHQGASGGARARDLAAELVDAPAAAVRRVALHALELAGAVVAARHQLGRGPGAQGARAPPRRQGQLLAARQLAGHAARAAGRGAAALAGRGALQVRLAAGGARRADVLLLVGRAPAHRPAHHVPCNHKNITSLRYCSIFFFI